MPFLTYFLGSISSQVNVPFHRSCRNIFALIVTGNSSPSGSCTLEVCWSISRLVMVSRTGIGLCRNDNSSLSAFHLKPRSFVRSSSSRALCAAAKDRNCWLFDFHDRRLKPASPIIHRVSWRTSGRYFHLKGCWWYCPHKGLVLRSRSPSKVAFKMKGEHVAPNRIALNLYVASGLLGSVGSLS